MNRVLSSVVLALLLSPSAHAAQGGAGSTVGDSAAALFKDWDGNGDGQLSPAEFRAGWERAQAVAKAQAGLARQFAAIDANHDHAIDGGEYANLVLVRDAGKAAPPLSRFDANGDGTLAFAEYVALVDALAPRHDARRDAGK